jgi:hypothetical protein
MAVKKKRSVEELEQLLKDSDRIRKDHLDMRREQLRNLRRERVSRFQQFVTMLTPTELDLLVTETLLLDPQLVDQAVKACSAAIERGDWYTSHGNRAPKGVFTSRPTEEESIRYQFKHIYDDINRYSHVFGALAQFFIEPILNRKATVEALDQEDLARIRRVYYPYRRNNESYVEDLRQTRHVLMQDKIEELVVRQKAIDAFNNTEIVYQLKSASDFIATIQKNLLSAVLGSSVAKSHEIISANSKINW